MNMFFNNLIIQNFDNTVKIQNHLWKVKRKKLELNYFVFLCLKKKDGIGSYNIRLIISPAKLVI
jgi:hypothetical protein